MARTRFPSSGRQRFTAHGGHHTMREIVPRRRLRQESNESPKGIINVPVTFAGRGAVQYLQRPFDFFVKISALFTHGVVLNPSRRNESARSLRARCSELLMVPLAKPVISAISSIVGSCSYRNGMICAYSGRSRRIAWSRIKASSFCSVTSYGLITLRYEQDLTIED